MLVAVVAMLASCSKDLTSDVNIGVNGDQNVEGIEGGITLVASVGDLTRVTIEGDNVAKTSELNWEVGDELTVVYDGKSYQYVTTKAGRISDFTPKDEANVFYPTDLSKPVAVFYNVKSVDAAAMSAVYDIAAEQTEGELTNKMPLYHYSANVVVEDGKLVATMNPLASVVELELTASKDWNVDALSLTNSVLADTYAVASGVTIDAATGAISLDNAEVGQSVKVKLAGLTNLATARKVQAVVMGLTRTVTTTETVTAENGVSTEVTNTTLYAPLYHAKAVLKLYKNGAENARRVIWGAYNPAENAVDEHKHIYQAVKDVLKDKVADGISSAEQFKAFADAVNGTTERYPAGAEFSNEDGVVVLKSNINLSAYTNWMAIGCNNEAAQVIKPQFVGIFDGNGNTISGLTINHNYDTHKVSFIDEEGKAVESYHNSAGLFGVVANGGVVKNLTVEGTIVEDMADPDTNWSYVGGVVAQISGGAVENCTSKVLFSAGQKASGKVRLGGVVGRVYAATDDVVVKNCKYEGEINISYTAGVDGQSVVGGVIAILSDGSEGCTPVVSDCSNSGAITNFNGGKDSYVGGVFGYITRGSEEESTLSNCTNTGAICGGSTAESCTAIHVGGVVGRQNCHTLYNCVNEGAVSLSENTTSPLTCNVGGVLGLAYGGANNVAYAEKCVNKGPVTVKGANTLASGLCAGGFVGFARYRAKFTDCQNYGEVSTNAGDSNTQTFAGAFAGKLGVSGYGYDKGVWLDGCVNHGNIKLYGSTTSTGWSYGGGIAGACYGGTDITADGVYGVHLTNCENKGTVSVLGGAKFRAGGVAGLNNCSAFYNCTHSGIVAMERKCVAAEYLGAIAGQMENQYSIIDGCVNSGTVCTLFKTARETGDTTSNIYVLLSGIIGNGGGAKCVISNCESRGKLLAAHDATLQYDDANKNWVIDQNTTVEYRATIAGNCNKSLVVKDCKIGGYVGVVTGGDGENKYEASVLHKLNNTEGDTYYYYRWLHGYNVIPKYSGMSFIDVE